MSDTRFLQLHTLTSYSGTLLNRDDAGFAKRLPFGGATRTRVSSQCLKYHWRNFDGKYSLYEMNVPRSIRSRRTFKQLLAQPLTEEGYPPSLVTCVVRSLKDRVLSDKNPSMTDIKKILQGDTGIDEALESDQITILGEPEIKYLKKLSREIMDPLRDDVGVLWSNPDAELSQEQIDSIHEACKNISKGDLKKNLKGLAQATGLDAAMFGRMTTSDALARGDAAVHVAHSFTTHAEESESDYFTAVDELKAADVEGELGSGHLNNSELSSGLFYGYVVVDVPLLISNLEGCPRKEWKDADRTLAGEVIDRFIHLMATVSPGAKLGSTAPYAWSECVLAEWGDSQPRTLANAFRNPVDEQPDLLANSYQALGNHVEQLDRMYREEVERKIAGIGEIDKLAETVKAGNPVSVDQIATWAAEKVRG
jgi:CRISPR system Cascade subunit CasC